MKITVSGKQTDVSDALRVHVEEGLRLAVEKYFDHAIEANVTFSREGHLVRADASVHVGKGITVQGRGEADDHNKAFDAAATHIGKQLRRYKRRLRDHHAAAPAREFDSVYASNYVLAPEPEEEPEPAAGDNPAIVAETQTELPVLSAGEAVMRMDLEGSAALMFRNRAHGGLNMVYRRSDGNIGWVDPQGNAGPDTN
jgi:ribosomal subunit interface protein